MKIVRFEAENVKRLRAVEISPDGTLQVITGRNGAGKSSVLDAIWLALGGGTASKNVDMPVRDGETKAHVTLDLGDLVVTRSWSGGKSTLKVEDAEGGVHRSPQGLLDSLVGRLSFDPLAFTMLKPAEQRDALLALVDLPFNPVDLDRHRDARYEERRAANRTVKQLEAEVAAIPKPEPGTPDREVSAVELIDQITASERSVAAEQQLLRDITDAEKAVETARDELANAEQQLATLTKELAFLPEPEDDVEALKAALADIESVNAAVRAKIQRQSLVDKLDTAREVADGLTFAIEEIDAQKAEGLAAAKFPVDGLGFSEDGVTYQGVPFSQASSAEQIRVSLAMAMASNPELRVIRILDGSLLDDDNLALITGMAADADYQVWIERVGTTADGTAVLIEDGQVAS